VVVPDTTAFNDFKMPNKSSSSSRPSKKAVAALRANADAIEQAFSRTNLVFARVDACLGNSQFRLKMVDGSEGRGTPLGKFTFATLRIAPGQVVICEPGKGVLTIIGRFDRHRDVNRLVKDKLIPRSFMTGDTEGACFEDGFEFEDEQPANADEDKQDVDVKVARLLNQYKSNKQRRVDPLEQVRDLAEAQAEAVVNENEEIDYESRSFKRTRKAPVSKKAISLPSADMNLYNTPEQPEDYDTELACFNKRPVPNNWEDDIDIDAI
jgi:translation initiation factor IF-1